MERSVGIRATVPGQRHPYPTNNMIKVSEENLYKYYNFNNEAPNLYIPFHANKYANILTWGQGVLSCGDCQDRSIPGGYYFSIRSIAFTVYMYLCNDWLCQAILVNM